MLNITTGVVARPQKVVIYGPEGIGKTSLAASLPDPLIIDTEGGTSHMDVRRIERPATWGEMLSIVGEVAETPGLCRTLVIDTADWTEQLITDYLLDKYKQPSIESFGYGKGYTYVSEEFQRLLAACDGALAAGMHVVMTAHAMMRKFEQPDEAGAYDRWELKLSKRVAPLLKEWSDHLLFCNYETHVVKDGNTNRGCGGRRVAYTSHHPAWDAKTRVPMPETVPLSYESIAPIFGEGAAPAEKKAPARGGRAKADPLAELRAMMERDGVSDGELRRAVASRGKYGEDVPLEEYDPKIVKGWVIRHWDRLLEAMGKGGEEDGDGKQPERA